MPYIGNTPALDYISYAVQNFTVTAGTTVYTLDYSVANENDIRLVINNVIQRPGASYAYSATGTTLTLTSATLATDTMYAVFIGRAVQTVTPPANSITNTMLAPSVITGQTAETSVAGGDQILIYDDSATALRKMTRTNFVAGLGSGFDTQLFHVRDEKSANTGGGSTVTGSFEKRTLNTTLTNEISGASISSSVITLPAGTYFLQATAPAYKTNSNNLRWYNISDSTQVAQGANNYAGTTNEIAATAVLNCSFTIAASKTFELQHYGAVTQSTNGFGVSGNLGLTEIYAQLTIIKVA